MTRESGEGAVADRPGRQLKPGMPADITVFRVDTGEYDLLDCYTTGAQGREADRAAHHVQERQAVRCEHGDGPGREQLVPADRRRSRAGRSRQACRTGNASFLERAGGKSCSTSSGRSSSRGASRYRKGTRASGHVPCSCGATQGLPLKEALRAVYASFLDQTISRCRSGLLLLRLEQPFALSRLRDVSGQRPIAA